MAENFIRRISRWVLWVVGGATLLVVGLHLLLPFLVNTHAVKSRMLQMAGETIPGHLDAVYLEPRLLPLPHLELTDLRYNLPGKLSLDIDSVDVHPHIVPLIRGRIQLRSMVVKSPKLSIELPANRHVPTPLETRSLPRDAIQAKDALADLPSDWELHITDGRVVLNRHGKAVAQFHGVDLSAAEAGDILSIEIDGAAETAGQFELDAKLDRRTLDGTGAVELTDFKVEALAEVVDEARLEKLPRGKVDLSLTVESKGVQAYQASIVFSSPELLIEREGRHIRLEKIDLEGAARLTPQRIDASLKRIRMALPKADLSGEFVWEWGEKVASSPLRLSVQARETDVTRLRGALLALFPELQSWTLFEVIQGGTLASMEMNCSGASWDQIGKLPQLAISGLATDSRIFVPGAELDLTDVKGEWQLKNGDLTVKNAIVHLGNTRGTGGFLKLGLTEDPMTIDLDIGLDADLAELPSVLKRLISDPEVLAEIDRIDTMEGVFSGRLRLSGPLDRPDLFITADHIDTRAGYSRLPETVALQGGPLKAWLTKGRFGLEGVLNVQKDVSLSTRLTVDDHQLDVQQLAIADAHSSADIALRFDKAAQVLDLRFDGNLDWETFAKLWSRSSIRGRAKGQFSAKVALDRPLASTLDGYLEAADLTLPIAKHGGVHITRADVYTEKETLNIKALDLVYADQRARISGSMRPAGEELVVDLKFSGEALDLDRILAAMQPVGEALPGESNQAKEKKLKLRGAIDVAFDRIVYDQRTLDSAHATVALEEDQTNITVHQGNLCGINIRGVLRRTPKGTWIDSEQQAEQRPLQFASGCLLKAQTTERLEGTYDIKGNLSTFGQTEDELVRRLQGVVDFNVVDGRVLNVGRVGLFTNILEYLSINKLITGDHPSMGKRTFKYDSLQLQLHIQDGLVELKTAEVRADALNMIATGTLDVATQQLDLTVLASPLTTVDSVVRLVPVVGKILKGTLIAIPIGVKGPLNDPQVIPLSPKAVGARLTEILGGILKAPVQLVEPILPSSGQEATGPKGAPEKSAAPEDPLKP